MIGRNPLASSTATRSSWQTLAITASFFPLLKLNRFARTFSRRWRCSLIKRLPWESNAFIIYSNSTWVLCNNVSKYNRPDRQNVRPFQVNFGLSLEINLKITVQFSAFYLGDTSYQTTLSTGNRSFHWYVNSVIKSLTANRFVSQSTETSRIEWRQSFKIRATSNIFSWTVKMNWKSVISTE